MSGRHTRPGYPAALPLIVMAGFALRLLLLDTFPLHQDEAIYGYWAQYGWHVDPLFLQVWPDKPPVFIWLLSLALEGWGASPAAARLLNVGISTLTIPVVAATARRWWGDMAGLGAGVLLALSPFAISFAPTVFTDPLLVLAGSLSLCLAARRRWFWSGLWLGVAIMTKQQGLLFVPLILIAGLATSNEELTQRRRDAEHSDLPIHYSLFTIHYSQFLFALIAFLLGFLLSSLPILYWDSLRWSVAPSPWDLGARNVGDVTFSAPAQWLSRLQAWGEQAWYLLASWTAWVLFGGALLVATLARRPLPGPPQIGEGVVHAQTAHSRIWGGPGRGLLHPAVWLALWAAFFLVVHVVTSVQVWDRYLLPLVLPLVLVGGWAAGTQVRLPWRLSLSRPARMAAVLLGAGVLVTALAVPAVRAAEGGLPVGGDHGAYSGLDQALDYVRAASAERNVVLYHRELGWHARFYLFDAIQEGKVALRYYPHAVYLADSATKYAHTRQFVIVPDWAPIRDLPWQLSNRGQTAAARLRAGHFTVLELTPQAGGDASWRACRTATAALPPWLALTGARGGDMMCLQ